MFNTDSYNTREYNESPNLTLSVNDDVGLSDAFSRVAEFFRSISDSLSMTDLFSKVWNGHYAISDSLSVSDSLTTKLFNRLSVVPRILGAVFKKSNGGSAVLSQPERDL